nr:hypothetical protein HK105_007643 [Polyrhizophydium stewartii]
MGFVGRMILRKKGSVAFFIDLLSPDRPAAKSPSPIRDHLESMPIEPKDTSPRSMCMPQTPASSAACIGSQAVPLHAAQHQSAVPAEKDQPSTLGIISFPKIPLRQLRPSPQQIKERMTTRMMRAAAARSQIIQARRSRLRHHAEQVSFRLLIQKQRDRLDALQKQAKTEYTMTAANIKRQMLLRRKQERLGAAVEHVHSVMLMQKLRKFLDLRRAFSENFADILKDVSLPHDPIDNTNESKDGSRMGGWPDGNSNRRSAGAHSAMNSGAGYSASARSPLMAGLAVDTSDEVHEYTQDSPRVEGPGSGSTAGPPSTVSSGAEKDRDLVLSPALIETGLSPVKASSRGELLLDGEEKRHPPGAPLRAESVASTIRRTKSMSSMLLVDADDFTYLELLSLLPPVTRFTLRELELEEILSNTQLRHDLVFDPDLQFKPNVENNREDERISKADAYWDEVEEEVSQGFKYRIPLLLAEVRAILIELLPNGQEIKEEIDANIDIKLIAQQIDHGVMNPLGLIEYIAGLMKINCAPIRDELVDSMVAACRDGQFVKTLRICFDVLELMKLVCRAARNNWLHSRTGLIELYRARGLQDYANHQLTRLRPYVIEHEVEHEWRWFKSQFESGSITLVATKAWLKRALETSGHGGVATVSRAKTPDASTTAAGSVSHATKQAATATAPDRGSVDLLSDALLQLILQANKFAKEDIVPETLRMDTSRLISYYNDWQDITILASLLVLFRQAAGPRCTAVHLAEAKRSLWVLLNDSDTTMSHISLQVAHTAGEIRGKAFSDQESKMLEALMEKTLAPESKLYDLIQKRVGENLRAVMETGTADKDMLAKHGLAQLESEVTDLAARISKVSELNRAVYGKMYAGLLDDIRTGDDASSPSAVSVIRDGA